MSRRSKCKRALRRGVRTFIDILPVLIGYTVFAIAMGWAVGWAEGWPMADGWWWGAVTTTTTGYGDFYPVTFLGRALAWIAMLGGIYAIGLIIAQAVTTKDAWKDEEQKALFRKLHKIHCAVTDLKEERSVDSK